ncbi:NEL-type E3 ubiquitin ligase domain-containing protein [Pseudomonas rubra]|uniref:RING-type E3 ubiquitin transferase n=1 Tax=Pseudomonas rubra TaxID=2942627 RepID=A0ABT5P8K2_9PSED|nr:NEL-type E3 ubiquitin ligase domain-containing protein [Pseudomonas rubra]MDD1014623.1 hypothetical protein [Pseudomonas rubra]MDD1040572.1 hypothetical protein [Pseudomonas rubra]MDD1153584.1 hypothetical protein [Pseudomonas rubra]
MPDSPDPQNALDFHQALQDTLPSWLRDADSRLLAELAYAMRQSRLHRVQVEQLLSPLTQLPEFARTEMIKAFAPVYGGTFDPLRDQICLVVFTPVLVPLRPFEVTLERKETQRSLLEAALDNFEMDEEQPGAFSAESYLSINNARVSARPEDFARRCRTLDLGARFQAHLRQQFEPVDKPGQAKGAAAKAVHEMLQKQRRSDLRVAAYLAYLKGDLTQWGFQLMQNLTANAGDLRVKNLQVRVFAVSLMGVRLREVLVIAQGPKGCTDLEQADSVILWIPGDRHGVVSEYASSAELLEVWRTRLAEPGYRQFLLRFAAIHGRTKLQAQLQSYLHTASSTPELDIAYFELAFNGNLINDRVQEQLTALYEDAGKLAVSTAQIDAEVRQRRLEWYEDAGLNVLGVAGLLIPGLGEVMLAFAAVELAHEVYDGFHAWHVGHRDEALQHLERALEQVAGVAAMAGVGLALQGLLRVSGFTQALHAVRLEDGQSRLWHPGLEAYRQPPLSGLGNAQEHPGLFKDQERHFLHLQGHHYAVSNTADGWHLQPVDPSQGFAPALAHNGDGGWLSSGESPWQWSDSVQIARRLGVTPQALSDDLVRQALAASGYDLMALRQLSLEHESVSAVLVDALERMAGARPLEVDSPGPAAALLRRDFPGLSARAARQLADSASDVERQTVTRFGKLPATLAERALRMLRELRLSRALLGFYQAPMAEADTARLAIHFVEQLEGWPGDAALSVTPASLVQGIGRGDDLFVRLYRQIPAALQGSLGSPTGLAQALAAKAVAQRGQCARVLGIQASALWWRAPQRLVTGGFGYPLSGRGRLAAIHPSRSGQVRALYPSMQDGEINTLIAQLHTRGVTLGDYLARRKLEFKQLDDRLRRWEMAAEEALQSARKGAAWRMRRAWGRQTERAYDNQGRPYGFKLDLRGSRIGALPLLEDCPFESVVELVLTDVALSEVPEDFLEQFPDLQHLSLDHNELQVLPAGLGARTQLKYLNLSHNRLSLAEGQLEELATLTGLEVLKLADNPLAVAPSLEPMPLLRQLHLQNCQLDRCPSGLATRAVLEVADLRNNRIAQLPAEVFGIQAGFAHRVLLADNPLNADSRLLLANFSLRTGANLGGLTIREQALRRAARYWLDPLPADVRVQREQQWALLEQENGALGFFDLLARLGATADFRLTSSDLQRRVWDVFDEAWASAELRSELFDLAASDVTCGDSVILHFSALEVRVLVQKASVDALDNRDGVPLLKLAQGLFRLERLDAFADQELAGRPLLPDRARDQVEVRLAYRLALARALELPGQPRSMLYADWAGVTTELINQARVQVLADEKTERLSDFIVSRDFWRRFLRCKYDARFSSLEQPFHRQLEVAEQEDVQYYNEVTKISRAREQAITDLVRELTADERSSLDTLPSH